MLNAGLRAIGSAWGGIPHWYVGVVASMVAAKISNISYLIPHWYVGAVAVMAAAKITTHYLV